MLAALGNERVGPFRIAHHWEQLEALREQAQAVSASQASQSARRSASVSRVRPA